MSECIYSIENFDKGGEYHELDSPRTLEACLRSGMDPSEVFPKSRKFFKSKDRTEKMVDMKYENFEKKRQEKVNLIKEERNKIILYTQRKLAFAASAPLDNTATSNVVLPPPTAEDKSKGVLEMEMKRMEALKRRQEKDLAKTIEREQASVVLQKKIAQTEEEERKRQKAHAKKVLEQKKIEEKKRQEMEAHEKRLLQEEEHTKKLLAKKEAEVAEKIAKNRLAMEKQLQKEARERDEERKQKMAEYAQKTAALFKVQEDLGEANKRKMLEREERIANQLLEKKEAKRMEVQLAREKAVIKIEEALVKHSEMHEAKKAAFNAAEKKRLALQKENAIIEREKLQKQATDREKKNADRHARLVDAYRGRQERRNDTLRRSKEKDKNFEKVQIQAEESLKLMKFTAEMKLSDKVDNVERVNRRVEFKKLQTLQKIYAEDHQFEEIMKQKKELYDKQKGAAKASLIRKHEIAEAMQQMKMTNDYSILDKLFNKKKIETKKVDDDDKEGPQTM